jgi:hypothetical protein
LPKFDDLVDEFLRRPKLAQRGPRWRSRAHAEYAVASIQILTSDDRSRMRGRIVLNAHRIRMPPKYCFAVVFRNERVFALDIEPGRSHRNLLVSGVIPGTHWQRWPMMDAEPDSRDRPFADWLQEFFERTNTTCKFRVKSPPRGVQLGLAKW